MKVQRIANPFTVYESQIPHQIPFARVLERVYENQIPIQKPFLKGFLRNLTNAKKGFFIRCTFINPKRVYYSAFFFTVWAVPPLGGDALRVQTDVRYVVFGSLENCHCISGIPTVLPGFREFLMDYKDLQWIQGFPVNFYRFGNS
jgi:hypothetical protein